MDKSEMVLQEQIDYFQLLLILLVFYLEKVFHKYQPVAHIHVLLQIMQKHIVGDLMSNLFFYFNIIFNLF
jgi:hypothetical protein